MKVLHVIASIDPKSGGPVEVLKSVSDVFSAAGIYSEVVTLDSENAEYLDEFPLVVTALGSYAAGYSYSKLLKSWLHKNGARFDFVILHGLWNYSSFGAWRGLRDLEVPYFIFTHGMLDPWFKAHKPFKHILKQLYWLIIEGRILKDARGVLFTCDEERELARGSFWGWNAYTELVVRTGIPDVPAEADSLISEFFQVFPEISGRKFILFLSRIHPKKGCDLLIEAFIRTAHDYPETDLVIAGPDQVGLRLELEKRVGDAGLKDRVFWLGMIAGNVKWGAFRAAEAFILPSHQENFGIVVVEALACSTPVLMTDKVNIWREVMLGGGGLVENDDLTGITSLIDLFGKLSSDERLEMGRRARQTFLNKFEIRKMDKDILKLVGLAP
tara:strand:+ start:6878 stop:8032 length:1155 start_codon:yes stop_codon:yes gene_type:complete